MFLFIMFWFFFFVFVLHLLLAIIVAITWCVMSFLALCYCYLAWCVTPCLVLLLLIMMCGPHLVTLLLFVVVLHPLQLCCCYLLCASSLPCIVVIYYGALPSPYTIAIVYCGLLLLLVWFFTFCFTLQLVIMVHYFHLALLLFVVVHYPRPYVIATCCGLSRSLYITTILYYGSSSFSLCCCNMLWCVTLALHYYCSLWFVIPHLVCFVVPCFVLLLHHSMPFPSFHFTFPCVIVVICCGLSFFALCYYLLVEVMYSPLLPCVGFKTCEMSCVVFKKKGIFYFF
jgi:hypothetical protein